MGASNLLKIVTINARTLSSYSKQEEIIHEIQANKQQITFIQESRICGFGIEQRGAFTLIPSSQKKFRKNGVCIIISPEVTLIDADSENSNDRMLAVKVQVQGLRLQLINAYAPTNEHKDSAKDQFYRQFQKQVNSMDKDYKLVMAGDMNATICQSSYGFWKCLGRNNYDQVTNDNGQRLLKFSEQNGFALENTKRQAKKIHTSTWSKIAQGGKIFEKRLDYFILPKFIRNLCAGCRVYRGRSASYDSDHKMVQLTLQVPTTRRKFISAIGGGKRKPAKPRLDLKALQKADINEKYCELLDQSMGKKALTLGGHSSDPTRDHQKIDEYVDETIKLIQKSTQEICPTLPKKEKHPWISDKYRKLLDDRRKGHGNRKEINKKIQRLRRKLENEYYDTLGKELNEAKEKRDITEEFRIAKNFNLSKKSRKLLVTKEKLTAHFTQHFAKNEKTPPLELKNPEGQPYLSSFLDSCRANYVSEDPPASAKLNRS